MLRQRYLLLAFLGRFQDAHLDRCKEMHKIYGQLSKSVYEVPLDFTSYH